MCARSGRRKREREKRRWVERRRRRRERRTTILLSRRPLDLLPRWVGLAWERRTVARWVLDPMLMILERIRRPSNWNELVERVDWVERKSTRPYAWFSGRCGRVDDEVLELCLGECRLVEGLLDCLSLVGSLSGSEGSRGRDEIWRESRTKGRKEKRTEWKGVFSR